MYHFRNYLEMFFGGTKKITKILSHNCGVHVRHHNSAYLGNK